MANQNSASSSVRARRATLFTLGCRVNQAETRLLEDQLRQAGYTLAPFGEPADLGVIHTCVVTGEAEAKSRKIIRRFMRANPGATTVVIGCYAQTNAEGIAAMPGVSLVLGNDVKMRLVEHLSALDEHEPLPTTVPAGDAPFTVPFVADGPPIRRRVNLKLQDGCDCFCTYCYVPFARGRSRSRRFDDAMAEAQCLVRRGAQELVLTGVNIGDYEDEGRGLTVLIDGLNQLCPKPRIRVSSIERSHIAEDLLERMADPNHALAPHLHIPLQSGSEKVLRTMGRPCAGDDTLDFMRHAAAQVPGLGLGADVMVGFPGESNTDFNDTYELVRRSPLFYLHVFQYSRRPGTAAARLDDDVPVAVKRARSKKLLALAKEKKQVFQQAWAGHCLEVLFERKQDAQWVGHAGNYLEVAVRTAMALENRRVPVHIIGHEKGRLLGTLVR